MPKKHNWAFSGPSLFVLWVALMAVVVLIPLPVKNKEIIFYPDTEHIGDMGYQLSQSGSQITEYDDFINIVKKDLEKIKPELKDAKITVYVGYYRYSQRIYTGAMLSSASAPNQFYIVVDSLLYHGLTHVEKKALMAHETGHLIHRYWNNPTTENIIKAQIACDDIAVKYVGIDEMKSLLAKLEPELAARLENLNKMKRQ